MVTIVGNYPVPTSSGYSAPETITGTSENDTIDHKGGSDQIDGGSGTDTVLFFDNLNKYAITSLAGITHVKALSGAISPYSGSNVVLTNVERLQFIDVKVALDISNNALETLQFISVIAPDLKNDLVIRGVILDFFDHGYSMEQLCQMALEVGLAPTDNTALVNTVYHNVIGGTPNPDLTNALLGYVEQNGDASFLATVAGLNINVDIVGLQQHGMEYL